MPDSTGAPDARPALASAAAPDDDPDPLGIDEPTTVVKEPPIDVRSTSLAIIALLAVVFTLKWASDVFIPLMLSVLLTYALAPLVDALERLKLSRWVGAGLILLAIGGATGGAVYSFGDRAVAMINTLPLAAQKLRRTMLNQKSGPSTIEQVQDAAATLEKAAAGNQPAPVRRSGVQRVIVEPPPFNVRNYLWTGTIGLFSVAGQLTLVVFLTYFALGSGDSFRRKLVAISGPTLEKKKITLKVLNEITSQIHRYLAVQVAASVLVGIGTGLALWAIGLENAVVWGIAAGVLNLIPYLGSVAIMGTTGLAAFLQFGEVNMALLVTAASFLIHLVIGQLFLPWLTSRASRMGPVVVFVAVLAFGWLWGFWGLLLGVPILMIVKAICDRVEDLQSIGELLGD